MVSNLDTLFEDNAIKNPKDVFYLLRQLRYLPRGHILSITNRPSVMEHMISCVYMFDYFIKQKVIIIPESSIQPIRNTLLYHDIHEILCGDIPSPMKNRENELDSDYVQSMLEPYVKDAEKLSSDDIIIIKVIDMLDFALTLREEINYRSQLEPIDFNVRRLYRSYTDLLDKIKEKIKTISNNKYKADYDLICLNILDQTDCNSIGGFKDG